MRPIAVCHLNVRVIHAQRGDCAVWRANEPLKRVPPHREEFVKQSENAEVYEVY